MESTYSVTEAQAKLPALLRELPVHSPVALTRHDRTVAYLISKDQMEGIIETMEIMANPEAMQAIRDYEAGRMKFIPLEEVLAAIDASLESEA
jgi:PHD/YefM family antitoxin component YafN of YafNO toxin-antitoxin module